MKITRMCPEDLYAYLNRPYNPPTLGPVFTREMFVNEWDVVKNKLEDLLNRYGEIDAFGSKDYNIGDSVSLSRGIGVEVTSEKLLNSELIPDVQELLGTLNAEYEVDFCILTRDGMFHLFVSRDKIRTNAPKSILARLVCNDFNER